MPDPGAYGSYRLTVVVAAGHSLTHQDAFRRLMASADGRSIEMELIETTEEPR